MPGPKPAWNLVSLRKGAVYETNGAYSPGLHGLLSPSE
jgi:hypothetical protein